MTKIYSRPLISIIIVNLSGKYLLLECLGSLKKSTYKNMEVIVVDNGSVDDSREYLKKEKIMRRKIILIENRENLGFAEANNQGVKKAKGEYILLLNNDTVTTPDFLEVLLKKINQNSSIAVVQPKIIFYNTHRLQSGGAFFTPLGFLYYFGYGQDPKHPRYNKRMELFSANGACMLIRKSVIDEIGLFDNDFFAYYEETDFCHRVWLAGYEAMYEPTAVIFHKGSQTSRKMNSEFVYFHSFKNKLMSSIKNFESGTLLKLVPTMILLYIFLIITYLLTLQRKSAFGVIRSLAWNIFYLPRILIKREKIQKMRKVEDKTYLRKVSRPFNIRYYFNMFLEKEVLLENEDYSS